MTYILLNKFEYAQTSKKRKRLVFLVDSRAEAEYICINIASHISLLQFVPSKKSQEIPIQGVYDLISLIVN